MMRPVYEYMKYIITNPIIVFMVVYLSTQWSFLYLQELPNKTPFLSRRNKFLSAIVNGLGVVFVYSLFWI